MRQLEFAAEVPIAITSANGEELHAVHLAKGRSRIPLHSEHTPQSISLNPDLLFIDKTRWNNARNHVELKAIYQACGGLFLRALPAGLLTVFYFAPTVTSQPK